MVKGFVSLLFFWIYFFCLIALFLFFDILNFSVLCNREGLVLTEEIIFYRLMFSYCVVAPTIFFLCAWRSRIYSDRENKFVQFLYILSLCLIALSMLIFFIYFPRESLYEEFPHLTSNFCSIGAPQNLVFLTQVNPLLADFFLDKISILFPFGSFWTIASHAIELNRGAFLVFGGTLFLLMSLSTQVFMASRWPLFNFSVGVLLIFIIAAYHRIWLIFSHWMQLSFLTEVLGIVLLNCFFIAVFARQLYRRRHGQDY